MYGSDLKSRKLREIERTELRFERSRPTFGESERDHPIFEHNAMDVLSMVVLLTQLQREARMRSERDPRYLISSARLALQRHDDEQAEACFRRAWTLDPHGLAGGEAIQRLSRLLTARSRWHDSVALWSDEMMITHRLERQIRARVELGRIYERELKNSTEALALAEQGLALINEAPSRRAYEKSHAKLLKRTQRLRKRLHLDEATTPTN